MIKLLRGVISGLENVIYIVIRTVTKSIPICNRGLFINWQVAMKYLITNQGISTGHYWERLQEVIYNIKLS